MRILPILLLCAAIGSCDGCSRTNKAATEVASPAADEPESAARSAKVVCPVCGLSFGSNEAVAAYEHEGKKYYFLIEDHKNAFAADPESYTESDKASQSE